MLLRSSNAVGYTNYADNVIKAFVKESAEAGIDVFRIFDSLNWVKGMTLAIDSVRESGKVAEAAICYTGDILDPSRPKYDLKYYVSLAKELESAGAHILGIKDMAGLLKPQAAYELVSALKTSSRFQSIFIHTIRVEMDSSPMQERLMQVLILLMLQSALWRGSHHNQVRAHYIML